MIQMSLAFKRLHTWKWHVPHKLLRPRFLLVLRLAVVSYGVGNADRDMAANRIFIEGCTSDGMPTRRSGDDLLVAF